MIIAKKLNEEARIPTKATKGSAGWDLYSLEDVIITSGFSEVVSTGIAVEIPENWVGLLTHRSSLAFKLDTISSFGVIDNDYRGEIKVKLFNMGSDGVRIKAGDRFAQLVVVPSYCQLEMVDSDILSDTDRGDGGMGSTGV